MSSYSEDKNLESFRLVKLELIETETSYGNYLEGAINQFINPLNYFCQELCGRYNLPLSVRLLLCRNIPRSLRSNLDDIISLSRILLHDLRSDCSVTKAFESILRPMTEAYSDYIFTYSEVVQQLLRDIETEEIFSGFLRECELRDDTVRLNLSSLLIMPIQRVPKYKLFIEKFMKHSEYNTIFLHRLKQLYSNISNIIDSFDTDIELLSISTSNLRGKNHKLLEILQIESLINAQQFIRESTLYRIKSSNRYS